MSIMPKDIVTSFRVDAELWKQARMYALDNGMTMKELLENLLRRELEQQTIRKGCRERR
jgi:hypothetical protein